MVDLWATMRADTPAFYPTDGTGFDVPLAWNGLKTVTCHFVNDWIQADDSIAPVSTSEPQALVATADLPEVAIDDSVVIQNVTFTVRDVRKDELDTLLILSVAS